MNNPIGPYLDLKQSLNQQLVMTPQLQQAIKLLQLNNLELTEFVEEELEKNPLLEKVENTDNQTDHQDSSSANTDNIQDEFDDSWTGNENPDVTYTEQDHSNNAASIGSGGDIKFSNSEDGFENRIESQKSLREHLMEQLTIRCTDNRDRMIGGFLIDQLDESG